MIGRPIQPAKFESTLRTEHHMRQLSSPASIAVSLLRRVAGSLLTFLGPSWDGPTPQIPAGRSLHARPRAEMAREAFARQRRRELILTL